MFCLWRQHVLTRVEECSILHKCLEILKMVGINTLNEWAERQRLQLQLKAFLQPMQTQSCKNMLTFLVN